MSTLEVSQLGEQVEEIPMASPSRLLKMGQDSAGCAVEGQEDTALLMWLQAHRVTRLFDRRQLRGEAERSRANSCCV